MSQYRCTLLNTHHPDALQLSTKPNGSLSTCAGILIRRLLAQADVGKARVGVFLCGPLPVQRVLRKLCASLSTIGETVFVFHAERF